MNVEEALKTLTTDTLKLMFEGKSKLSHRQRRLKDYAWETVTRQTEPQESLRPLIQKLINERENIPKIQIKIPKLQFKIKEKEIPKEEKERPKEEKEEDIDERMKEIEEEKMKEIEEEKMEEEEEEEENVELVEKTDIKQRLNELLHNTVEEFLHNTVLVPLREDINKSTGNITSEIDILKNHLDNNGNIYKSTINDIDIENDLIQLELKKQELDQLNQLNDTGDVINLDLSLKKIKEIQSNKSLTNVEKIYKTKKFIKSKLLEMEKLIKNPIKKRKLKTQTKTEQLNELKKYLK